MARHCLLKFGPRALEMLQAPRYLNPAVSVTFKLRSGPYQTHTTTSMGVRRGEKRAFAPPGNWD